MLPVSGAEQLKTMGETRLRPMTSQSIPYSQLVRPTPISSSGHEEVPQALGLRLLAQLDERVGIGLVTEPT